MLPVMATEPDDTTLMLRYRDGDVAAFETLYARHRGPLYRYFLRSVSDRDTAAELFQEVWTRIVRAAQRYEARAKFTTYMYQLAHNVRIDHYRRQSRRPRLVSGDGGSSDVEPESPDGDRPDRALTSSLAGIRLRSAIAALPDDQRDAFLLREEGGLSLAEIAAATGVAPETAKSRLRYAVAKLRAGLADLTDE